jgi:transcriptional regulator with GAF, ATPase, and Fis domain
MHPRLLPVSGKKKGTEFALSEKETSIGREDSNVICLNEQSVSRRHCLIKQDKNGRFFIQDLDSYNGVFVNGTPIRRHEIKHGDQIGVGDVIMFFLVQENEGEASFQEAQLAIVQDGELNEQSTVRLKRKDLAYLSPDILAAELSQFNRVATDFSVLLRIASALNSTHNLENLQQRLLELVGEVIPAERSAVIMIDGSDMEDAAFHVWNAESNDVRNIQVSKTVVEHCLAEGVSILCNDIWQDEKLGAAESLIRAGVKSILCVPLQVFDRLIGILYLDNSKQGTGFDPDHLQLLTCIAEIAARPLENAKQIENLRLENQRLLDHLEENRRIIGESKKMKDIFRMISRIAPAESTVLILGESGTGKELAARAIHQNSARRNNPFVAINCATLTDNFLESELFGHERGAFTGAASTKIGQFEFAEGGTLFLDEIGELSPHLQAKLLRVLQEKEITRLGAIRPKKIDVRILAATNRNLEKSILESQFREDLYYRLNVISINMPPLRDRTEDISLLTHYFINKYNDRCKRNIKGIAPEAKICFQKHVWMGNVRELENAIERAVILAQSDMITTDDLPDLIANRVRSGMNGNADSDDKTFRASVRAAKKKIIQDALNEAGGHITKAAELLAMHPNNLHRLIKELALRSHQDI